jgi:hypothetical protein
MSPRPSTAGPRPRSLRTPMPGSTEEPDQQQGRLVDLEDPSPGAARPTIEPRSPSRFNEPPRAMQGRVGHSPDVRRGAERPDEPGAADLRRLVGGPGDLKQPAGHAEARDVIVDVCDGDAVNEVHQVVGEQRLRGDLPGRRRERIGVGGKYAVTGSVQVAASDCVTRAVTARTRAGRQAGEGSLPSGRSIGSTAAPTTSEPDQPHVDAHSARLPVLPAVPVSRVRTPYPSAASTSTATSSGTCRVRRPWSPSPPSKPSSVTAAGASSPSPSGPPRSASRPPSSATTPEPSTSTPSPGWASRSVRCSGGPD